MDELKASLDGTGLRIGVVRSRFNEEIGRAFSSSMGFRSSGRVHCAPDRTGLS